MDSIKRQAEKHADGRFRRNNPIFELNDIFSSQSIIKRGKKLIILGNNIISVTDEYKFLSRPKCFFFPINFSTIYNVI
jgi:hypothetical protein